MAGARSLQPVLDELVRGLVRDEVISEDCLGWLRTFAGHAAAALTDERTFEEIQELRDQLELVPPAEACVLISWESGMGKKLIASAIHERCPLGPVDSA